MKNNAILQIPSLNWSNKDNLLVYEKTPIFKLKECAAISGLDSCCDLRLIHQYIQRSSSILEIGAGAGRVLDYLINSNYQGEISAVECCQNYCQQLLKRFGQKISVYCQNLLRLSLPKQFDLILWMWSGIADFAPAEHLLALKNLLSTLTDHGILIFDTLDPTVTPAATKYNKGQEYYIDIKYGIIRTYSVTKQELDQYAKKLHFIEKKQLHYTATNGKERILHIVKKA